MNEPLVTCICLSLKERRDTFLPRAVECFDKQTYPRKELVIVTEKSARPPLEFERGLLLSITFTHPPATIGKLRNFACEKASGEILAVWDDDDYSAPERLEWQVRMLQETKISVTGYRSMKFTDGSNWWHFRYQQTGIALGTSLCFCKDWWKRHPFDPEYNIGEDVRFSDEAWREGELILFEGGYRMYATLHPGNTSKKRPEGEGWLALPGFSWPGTINRP